MRSRVSGAWSDVDQLEMRAEDERLAMVVDKTEHLLAHLVRVAAVRAHACDPDHRRLPEVLVGDLGHGHVEGVAELGGEGAHHLTLVLEGFAVRYLDRDGQRADDHVPSASPETGWSSQGVEQFLAEDLQLLEVVPRRARRRL